MATEAERSYRDGQLFIEDQVMIRVTGQAYLLQAKAPPVGVVIAEIRLPQLAIDWLLAAPTCVAQN